MHPFSRTELLTGREGLERLSRARVAVFGVGGVGGYVVEALVRSGIGSLDLIDPDKVSLTNLNRQIIATRKTIGKYKVEAAKERILDINPQASVNTYQIFYMPQTAGQFDFSAYDYVVDAIDTVTGKITLVQQAQASNVPIISSMGAGNKMDPSAFRAADIYETSVCPLAKTMRRELKKRGITKLKVVYSTEKPCKPLYTVQDSIARRTEADAYKLQDIHGESGASVRDRERQEEYGEKRSVVGSMSFVPAAAGLIIASEVVRDLLNDCC